MFGLFNRKKITPSVTEADKEWIEKNIGWFIETFGVEHLAVSPFIIPTPGDFPFNNLFDEIQFQQLFVKICAYWNINPNEIIVKFFDDTDTKQWATWVSTEKISGAAGLFSQVYTADEKRFKIELAKSTLSNPALLINVMAHELGHVKLIGGHLIKRNDADMEPLTDLVSIYFGFGIFMANTSITSDKVWLLRTGYIQSEMISYANALLCFITGKDCNEYLSYLNPNTKDFFVNDYNYLKDSADTLLNKWNVDKLVLNYTNNKILRESFKKRDYEAVIKASVKLIEINPKSSSLHNTLGYALLLQKKYDEAIVEFTNAITIDPYWDYPYNNRGYCKLQLNDFENAFPDLHSAFEMNQANSFAWRNMGVYYFLCNDSAKALEYLEEAEVIDPKTEMINFYLSKVHHKLGNAEKALHYSQKSKEKDEYNDSVIE